MKRTKKTHITKKLLHKYRLVILNEDTFEERFSLKLSRLNVFVLVAITAIVLVTATTFLIAFTSLREYIPGYSSTALKIKATELNYKTDSLLQVIAINEKYFNSIKKVLVGEISPANFDRDSIFNEIRLEASEVDLSPTKEDSILRAKVEKEDKFNLFEPSQIGRDFVLFPPVNGSISEPFNVEIKHYAVDLVVQKNAPIKATADGIVIFSEWTTDTGYVIIIDHGNDLISAYKHNASLIKSQGDLVKAGEVIAVAGSTGEFSTGPHLHFELWHDGYPINPTNYIDF